MSASDLLNVPTPTTGGRSRGRRLSDALLQVVPNLPQMTRPPVSKLAKALAKAGLSDKHNGQPVSLSGSQSCLFLSASRKV